MLTRDERVRVCSIDHTARKGACTMPMSTVYRDMHHTDHEHAARVNGFGAGYDHANYVDNVTSMPDATVPSEYADVAAVWDEAYQDGKDDYAATEEDEATYGHDWRG